MIGQTISHYRILAKLGEGGMGVVYKAEDTKLNRLVALKFLPAQMMASAAEKTRFVHEARAAAALNHPNICTIYEVDEVDGESFIAMEFIEGQSLKEMIEAGPPLLDGVVNIAMQVAEGLQAAHEKGVTHRDIKPANIMVTTKGQAKIMDFGLAKLAAQKMRLTKTGMTVGTLAYMSPEQAQGIEADHRTDIWSFGVVLYEMITGRLPFRGEYEAAIAYSIMHEQPEPLARYKASVSEGLQRIVDKALDKDRETRYQHVDELLADLKRERKSTAELVKPVTVKRKSFRPGKLKLAAFALTFAVVLLVSLYLFNLQPAKHVAPTHKQLTFVGDAMLPAISPDGQFIAYVTGQFELGQKLMVQDLVGGQPLEVYQADMIVYPRWSPNGAELVFSSEKGVTLLPRLGGNARNIPSQFFTCWSPDGSQIASSYSDPQMTITSKSTGERAYLPLSKSFSGVRGLDWSPLGNRLAFLTQAPQGYTIWTIKIDGSEQQMVLQDSLELFSPRWSADGRAIYYLRSDGQTQDLMKVRISPESGKRTSSPATLLAGLPFGDYFTLTHDNKRLLYTRATNSQNLWLITLKGEGRNRSFETKPLTTGTLWAHDPAISPDGKSVVFSIGKRPRANLFVMPLIGGPMQQLTFLNSYNAGAVWSSDGNEIAFGSTQDGISRVWKVNSTGGTPRPFLRSELSDDPFSLTWSPGADILYQPPGNQNFHFLNPTTEAERPLLEKTAGWIFFPRYSPDAKNVAVSWYRFDQAGKSMAGIWVLSLKDISQVRYLYREWVYMFKWSADGKWIYAWDFLKKPLKIFKIPIDGGQPQDIIELSFEGYDSNTKIDLSPDEKQLVYPNKEEQSDVWLVENFDPDNELDKPVAVTDFPAMKQLPYLQKGTDLYRPKKYSEAEAVFRKGLDLNPKHVALLFFLGQSLYGQRKYSEAQETVRQGLAIEPEHRALLDGIRWAAFNNKNLAAARSYNEKYLEGASERSEKLSALVDLGAIGILQKDYAVAEKDLRQALAMDSTSASANLQMGYLFAEQGRYAEAKTFAEKALAVDSSFAVYSLMAYVLAAGENDLDRGIAYANKALNVKPKDQPQAVPAYSWNDFIVTMQSRAATYSYYAIPEHTLGLAYLKKGEYPKAAQYLEQAAALAPEKQAIRDYLQLAKQKLQERGNK